MKIKAIRFNDRNQEMVDALRDFWGQANDSATIKSAISMAFQKTFPAYASAMDKNISPEKLGEMRARQTAAKDKYIDDQKTKEKRNICENILFGKVVEEGDGNMYCEYTNFTPDPAVNYPQKFPLMAVVPSLVDNLFIPSREVVLKRRPKLKKELGL